MNYPIDNKAVEELAGALQGSANAIVLHDRAMRKDLLVLTDLVQEAVKSGKLLETIWHDEADAFLKTLKRRKLDDANLRFNQKNGQAVPTIVGALTEENFVPVVGKDAYETAKLESNFNRVENEFGPAMDEAELARYFNEPTPVNAVDRMKKPLTKMTLEEIEKWEKDQDNSNDVYKVNARVKNLARGEGAALTPVGDILANTYTHVLLAFYKFADTLNQEDKVRMYEVVRSQEGFAGTVINAAGAGVRTKK